MAVGTSPDGPAQGQHVPTPVVLEAGDASALTVPGGAFLLTADYGRSGPDLVLTGDAGAQVVIRGFFATETPPNLMTEGGARITGALAEKLAGPLAPGQVAQAAPAGQPLPIGSVQSTNGQIQAIRADGTTVTLNPGDPVFQGDTIETSADGAVGIIFNDNTTFSLSEGGRMVLDEFVYDPGTQAGTSQTSLVQGVFSFVSGQIAASGEDAMKVTTPVATIGIRGTTVAGRAAQEGEINAFALFPDPDGGVGVIAISNDGGVQILSLPGESLSLSSFTQAPPPPAVLELAQLEQQFGSALAARPQQRTAQEQQQQEEQQQQQQQQQQQGGGAPGEGTPGEGTPGEGEPGEGEPGEGAPGEGEAPLTEEEALLAAEAALAAAGLPPGFGPAGLGFGPAGLGLDPGVLGDDLFGADPFGGEFGPGGFDLGGLDDLLGDVFGFETGVFGDFADPLGGFDDFAGDLFGGLDFSDQDDDLFFGPDFGDFDPNFDFPSDPNGDTLSDSGDTFIGDDANDTVTGGNGPDFIDGGGGDDFIDGAAGDDTLDGGAGNDTVFGSAGNDKITASLGDDFYDGGDEAAGGVDQLKYGDFTSSVVIDNANGIASGTGFNHSLANIEDFTGTDFDDSFISGSGSDLFQRFEGLGGNDTITGPSGSIDILELDYRESASAISATIDIAGNGGGTIDDGFGTTDTVSGISALSGSFRVRGTQFDDTYVGNLGNDKFRPGAGNDYYDGGIGSGDEVDYRNVSGQTGGVVVDLGNGYALDGTGGNDSLVSIERARGSFFDDTLIGDGNNNRLRGNDGADTLIGGNGSDTLRGGQGDDVIFGNGGADDLDYAGATSGVTVDIAAGTATGGDGNDTFSGIEGVFGSAFGDTFYANGGELNVGDGGAGADHIFDSDSDESFEGGDDIDTLNYSPAGSAVSIDLTSGTASGGSGNDSFVNIEVFVATDFDDTMTGASGDNTFFGGGGNDTLDGQDGSDFLAGEGANDSVIGGNGDDTLYGNAGDDQIFGNDGADSLFGNDGDDTLTGGNQDDELFGGDGNDSLVGGDGNDDLEGGLGDDSFSGGNGTDEVIYANASGSVTIDFFNGTAAGADGNDTFGTDIEGASGSQFDDTFIGCTSADDFGGLNGDDVMDGGAGDDTLLGDLGNDTLTGNAGNDSFVYENVLSIEGFTDQITDFQTNAFNDNLYFESNNDPLFDFNGFTGNADAGGFFFTSSVAYDGLAGTGVALSGSPTVTDDFFVLFNDSGNSQQFLYYDRDGAGSNFETVAVIQGDTIDGNDIIIT